MAGYRVSALAIEQHGPASRFTLAVSVHAGNEAGVPNLNESNFSVHTVTSDVPFMVSEVQSVGTPGFYRLLLRTEPNVQPGEYVLALVAAGHHQVVGRVPTTPDSGSVLVKVRVV